MLRTVARICWQRLPGPVSVSSRLTLSAPCQLGEVMASVRAGIARLVNMFWVLLQNLRFLNVVRRQQADVVWIRGSKGILFAGLGTWLSGKPLIWDVDYELPSVGMVRWLHRFGLWAARCVVCQYQSAPESIFGETLAKSRHGKLHSIIPGIELDRLEQGGARRGRGQDSRYLILQVGTVCERKNQLFLVEVIARLKARLPGWTIEWQIAGEVRDEEYARQIREAAQALGVSAEVRFLGWRQDVQELMAGADVLVMPSFDEGVPNTVQEAMYLGVPVVASPVGGIPEIIRHGATGWIAALDDPGQWEEALVTCAVHPDTVVQVTRAASDYAARCFTTSHWGAEYLDLIRKIRAR